MEKCKTIDVCFLDLDTKRISHITIAINEKTPLTYDNVKQACLEEAKHRNERRMNDQNRLYEAAKQKYNLMNGLKKDAIEWSKLPLTEKNKYGYDPLSDYFKQYDMPTGEIIAWSQV